MEDKLAHQSSDDEKRRSFGKRLREARDAKGLTQDELGNRIGLSGNSISQYEAGRAYPRQKPFGLLLRELEVSSSYLLTGHDPEEKIKAQTKYEKRILEILRETDPKNQEMLVDMMQALSESLERKESGK